MTRRISRSFGGALGPSVRETAHEDNAHGASRRHDLGHAWRLHDHRLRQQPLGLLRHDLIYRQYGEYDYNRPDPRYNGYYADRYVLHRSALPSLSPEPQRPHLQGQRRALIIAAARTARRSDRRRYRRRHNRQYHRPGRIEDSRHDPRRAGWWQRVARSTPTT